MTYKIIYLHLYKIKQQHKIYNITTMTTFDTNTDFIVAEVQAVYSMKVKSSELTQITNSNIAHEILLKTWNGSGNMNYTETFKVMLLNTANKVLGVQTLSTGCQSMAAVDKKVLFASILSAGATSIILAHNHPSGALKASTADIRTTNEIKELCKLFDIKMLDHIILTDNGYLSMVDNGDI